MRIILINDVSEAKGGATKVFLKCIGAAVRAGLDVTAIVGDDGRALASAFPGLHVLALNQAPLREGVKFRDPVDKLFNIKAMHLLAGELRHASPDTIIHIHGWMQILSPSIFYALRGSSLPVMITAHDFFLECPNGAFVDYKTGEVCRRSPLTMSCLSTNCDKRNYLHKLWRSQRSLVQRLAGEAFWSSANIVLVHEKMKDYIKQGRLTNMFVLRTPTDAFVPYKVSVRDNSAITFLGRMTWEKGVDILVEALNRLGRSAHLLGTGPLLDRVRQASPQSYCPGWVRDEDVPSLLAQARLFVMPSRMPEPYGLVAVEAMKSGLPVVVSRNSLISDEIEANGAGFTYDSNDPGALAAALERLISDDDLAAEMGDRAYETGRTFAPDDAQWEQDMLGLYDRVSGQKAGLPPTVPGHAPATPFPAPHEGGHMSLQE